MYYYQVTKYNPAYRNEKGWYIKDEWTDFSCIGHEFGGKLCTLEEYTRIEDLYIQAVLLFMNCLNIDFLKCTYCWKPTEELDDKACPESWRQLYARVRKRSSIHREDLPILLKLILRNYIGCKLENNNKMFVYFAYDYYMDIGVEKECEDAVDQINKSGLFVERLENYYFDEEDE